MGIAALLITYFTLFIALYVAGRHILNKIQNLPPSPFPSLPIIGHLYLLKRPIYRTLSKISNKYGPLIFLQFGSRKVVVVSSPSFVEECFTKYDIVFANRPRLTIGKLLGYNNTMLIWSSYGDHLRNLRRIASLELLSTNRLQLLSNIRTEEVKALASRLFRDRNQNVNLKTAFFELTLNVIMRMIADESYFGDARGVEKEKRFQELYAETVRLSGEPNIEDYIPWIRSKKLQNRLIKCQRKRDEFMQELIDEQRKEFRNGYGSEKKKNLIQVLLSLQETEPAYYTDEIIKGLLLVLILGGTDTSTNTMEWALSLLLSHPEVIHRAQSEIDRVVGHHRLVNETDLTHLPYLQSIIKETMRLYPPAPLLVPHESSEECSVGGYRIPRGTTLFVNAWAIHNDPNIWDNPREFRPDRFEGVEGARDGFKFLPFGYGRRSCPGESLGLRVVGLALASLIQCFEWDKIDENKVDMTEGFAMTLPKAQPLKAICRPRPFMVKLLSQI